MTPTQPNQPDTQPQEAGIESQGERGREGKAVCPVCADKGFYLLDRRLYVDCVVCGKAHQPTQEEYIDAVFVDIASRPPSTDELTIVSNAIVDAIQSRDTRIAQLEADLKASEEKRKAILNAVCSVAGLQGLRPKQNQSADWNRGFDDAITLWIARLEQELKDDARSAYEDWSNDYQSFLRMEEVLKTERAERLLVDKRVENQRKELALLNASYINLVRCYHSAHHAWAVCRAELINRGMTDDEVWGLRTAHYDQVPYDPLQFAQMEERAETAEAMLADFAEHSRQLRDALVASSELLQEFNVAARESSELMAESAVELITFQTTQNALLRDLEEVRGEVETQKIAVRVNFEVGERLGDKLEQAKVESAAWEHDAGVLRQECHRLSLLLRSNGIDASPSTTTAGGQ